MRVVLATNILISAFVFPGGIPETVYRAALERRITLITSPPLLAELGRVLQDKFGWDPMRSEDAVAQVARIGEVVRPIETIETIAEDPADNRVLEAAETGHADLIVSGDRHLLNLTTWHGIEIVKAAALQRLLS